MTHQLVPMAVAPPPMFAPLARASLKAAIPVFVTAAPLIPRSAQPVRASLKVVTLRSVMAVPLTFAAHVHARLKAATLPHAVVALRTSALVVTVGSTIVIPPPAQAVANGLVAAAAPSLHLANAAAALKAPTACILVVTRVTR